MLAMIPIRINNLREFYFASLSHDHLDAANRFNLAVLTTRAMRQSLKRANLGYSVTDGCRETPLDAIPVASAGRAQKRSSGTNGRRMDRFDVGGSLAAGTTRLQRNEL